MESQIPASEKIIEKKQLLMTTSILLLLFFIFPAMSDDCYDYMDDSDPGGYAEHIYPDILYRRASASEHLYGLI